MAFDPLHCLGAVFLAGITRKHDPDGDGDNPVWKRVIGGIATAMMVGVAGGGTGGYVAAQVALARHDVKIEELEKRAAEHRAEDREEFRDIHQLLREKRK
jgi:hypothetical protein